MADYGFQTVNSDPQGLRAPQPARRGRSARRPASKLGDVDPLLSALAGSSEELEQRTIADLLTAHALPVVDETLESCLSRFATEAGAELEDLRSDIVVRLLRRIRRWVLDPASAPIHKFSAYVNAVTRHGVSDYVASLHPARTALLARLRYVLGRGSLFALWQGVDGRLVAGFASWRQSNRRAGVIPAGFLGLRGDAAGARALRDALRRLFSASGGPLELGVLLDWLVELLQIREPSTVRVSRTSAPAKDPGPLARLQNRERLRQLWREIAQLPVRQRIALLLNAREGRGGSVARSLAAIGVVTAEEIRKTLELEPSAFDALWPRLPIADDCIALHLGLPRQQVINLRKSARERLSRRMASAESSPRSGR